MKDMIQRISVILAILLLNTTPGLTQITISADSSATDPSAIVEVKSTEKGFLPPRMTTEQRDAIVNPSEGLVIYNLDFKTIDVFNGKIWTLNTGKFTCGVSQVMDAYSITYRTVQVGSQCWMAQNLNAGFMIDSTQNQLIGGIKKYCFRNSSDSCDVYGGLYQWNEVVQFGYGGTQGICPDGWHIPTSDEWTILANSLGGTAIAGAKLKEAGSAHWLSPNTGTNSSGFSARGAGYRSTNTRFEDFLMAGLFWAYDEEDETYANAVYVTYNADSVAIHVDFNKLLGLSVRCVRNPENFHH